ncbi:Actin-related protein 6 [Armadillidium vulgare]|nr:Actin-related protein 6 [Armadillidium vulgare]
MAAEAEAAREARAKVIAAEGEQKASGALKEAADVISTSPAAIQLRYLQYHISRKELNNNIPPSFRTVEALLSEAGGSGGIDREERDVELVKKFLKK